MDFLLNNDTYIMITYLISIVCLIYGIMQLYYSIKYKSKDRLSEIVVSLIVALWLNPIGLSVYGYFVKGISWFYNKQNRYTINEWYLITISTLLIISLLYKAVKRKIRY